MSWPRTCLYDLCDGMLQSVVAGWPGAPVIQLPERQCVGDNDAVWDCEGLTVLVEQLYPTQGDVTAQQWSASPPLLGIKSAVIAVWLLRCVPDIDVEGSEPVLPTPTDVTASAFDILGDAITVADLIEQAQLADHLATCSGLTYENWTPARSGGIGGGVTRYRAQLLPAEPAS